MEQFVVVATFWTLQKKPFVAFDQTEGIILKKC